MGEAKTRVFTRTERTLAEITVDLVQCVYCIMEALWIMIDFGFG